MNLILLYNSTGAIIFFLFNSNKARETRYASRRIVRTTVEYKENIYTGTSHYDSLVGFGQVALLVLFEKLLPRGSQDFSTRYEETLNNDRFE